MYVQKKLSIDFAGKKGKRNYLHFLLYLQNIYIPLSESSIIICTERKQRNKKKNKKKWNNDVKKKKRDEKKTRRRRRIVKAAVSIPLTFFAVAY